VQSASIAVVDSTKRSGYAIAQIVTCIHTGWGNGQRGSGARKMISKINLEPEDIEAIAIKLVSIFEDLIKKEIQWNQPSELMDVRSLASFLGVEPSWVYKQVRQSGIPFFKVGKYTRFRRSDIERWIERNKN